MTKKSIVLGLLATGLMASEPARAALIDITETFDLNNGFVAFQPLGEGPVAIAVGDRVSWTIDFSGSQTLSISDGFESITAWLFGDDGNSDFAINNIGSACSISLAQPARRRFTRPVHKAAVQRRSARNS